MRRFVSPESFRSALRTGHGVLPTQKTTTAEPQPKGGRKVRFVFSNGDVDRMGDVLSPQGWQLDEYLKNPVVLWAHDAAQPPIGRASDVRVEGGQLKGTVEFADADTYPFADTIYRLVKGGWINACSVGFQPLDHTFSRDPDRPYGVDFHAQSLMEVSIVPVPALGSALVEERGMRDHTCELRRIRARHVKARLARPVKAPADVRTAEDRRIRARVLQAKGGVGLVDERLVAAEAAYRLLNW
jgi:HK97 family phage prohead protease